MTPSKARMQNPLVLAYIGDSVFDIYVRTGLVVQGKGNVGNLHRISSKIVNAKAQCIAAKRLLDTFSEEEKSIFMRGRNAKPATVPKNMSIGDYAYATGLEAVIGYLFLTGDTKRIEEIMKDIMERENEA